MDNQLFRTIMPYMVELDNSVLRIYNRGGIELFCCKMNVTKKSCEFVRSLSHSAVCETLDNCIRSYLYNGRIKNKTEFENYMTRFYRLLDYMDAKIVWNPGYEYGNPVFFGKKNSGHC